MRFTWIPTKERQKSITLNLESLKKNTVLKIKNLKTIWKELSSSLNESSPEATLKMLKLFLERVKVDELYFGESKNISIRGARLLDIINADDLSFSRIQSCLDEYKTSKSQVKPDGLWFSKVQSVVDGNSSKGWEKQQKDFRFKVMQNWAHENQQLNEEKAKNYKRDIDDDNSIFDEIELGNDFKSAQNGPAKKKKICLNSLGDDNFQNGKESFEFQESNKKIENLHAKKLNKMIRSLDSRQQFEDAFWNTEKCRQTQLVNEEFNKNLEINEFKNQPHIQKAHSSKHNHTKFLLQNNEDTEIQILKLTQEQNDAKKTHSKFEKTEILMTNPSPVGKKTLRLSAHISPRFPSNSDENNPFLKRETFDFHKIVPIEEQLKQYESNEVGQKLENRCSVESKTKNQAENQNQHELKSRNKTETQIQNLTQSHSNNKIHDFAFQEPSPDYKNNKINMDLAPFLRENSLEMSDQLIEFFQKVFEKRNEIRATQISQFNVPISENDSLIASIIFEQLLKTMCKVKFAQYYSEIKSIQVIKKNFDKEKLRQSFGVIFCQNLFQINQQVNLLSFPFRNIVFLVFFFLVFLLQCFHYNFKDTSLRKLYTFLEFDVKGRFFLMVNLLEFRNVFYFSHSYLH